MPRNTGTAYPKLNDIAAILYVMSFSDGRSKIGYSRNPEARRTALGKEPRHAGIHLELVWQSDVIAGVRRFEARAKQTLGSLPWGGERSNEIFNLPPAVVIAAAQNALLVGPLEQEPKIRKSRNRNNPINEPLKLSC